MKPFLLILTILFFITSCQSGLGGGTETGNPTIVVIPTTPSNSGDGIQAGITNTDTAIILYGATLAQGTDGDPSIAGGNSDTISNAHDFSVFWDRLFATTTPKPELPTVDFSTTLVLTTIMGPQTQSGYKITINSATNENGELSVSITRTSPCEGTETTAMNNNPYHIASIPRFADPVTSVTYVTTENCE